MAHEVKCTTCSRFTPMELAECQYCGTKFDDSTIDNIVKQAKIVHVNDTPKLWRVTSDGDNLGLYFGYVEDIAGYLSAKVNNKFLLFTKFIGPKIHKITSDEVPDNARPIAIKLSHSAKHLSHDEEVAFWNFVIKNQTTKVTGVNDGTCFLKFE